MKKKILIIIIYLIGCVISYKTCKQLILNEPYHKVWTKTDRNVSIMISLFSWVSVITFGVVEVMSLMINDEKANW